MPGILKHYAQNVSRSYAVTQAQQGAYFFADSDLAAWVSANASKVNQLGSLYLVDGVAPGSTFLDVVLGDNGATELNHSNANIFDRKTIKDLGKEVFIGTSAEPRLLVLRRVQRFVDVSANNGSLNSNDVGYVVTENNASRLLNNTGRFTVRVARV